MNSWQILIFTDSQIMPTCVELNTKIKIIHIMQHEHNSICHPLSVTGC